MDPQYIIDNENALIGDYPNTYTWSKSMAERALLKKHGNLRVAIVRPSIVISSYQEPTPGWIDSLAAAGGIIFGATSGLMHAIYASPDKHADIIPVDYVSNTTICATVYAAMLQSPDLIVCNSGTGHLNPISIKTMAKNLSYYGKFNPYYRQFSKVRAIAVGKPWQFYSLNFLQEQLPAKLFQIKANLPFIGSEA
jgi:alcohol-forming fatty acyl-CoA reductase